MDFKKKLLYKMLVKYYLSDNIKASLEDSVLDLQNVWASPVRYPSNLTSMVKIFHMHPNNVWSNRIYTLALYILLDQVINTPTASVLFSIKKEFYLFKGV